MYLSALSNPSAQWKPFLDQIEAVYAAQHRTQHSLTRIKNAAVAEVPATSTPIDFIFAQYLAGVLKSFFKQHPELMDGFNNNRAAIAQAIGTALAQIPLKVVAGKDLYTVDDRGELLIALGTIPYKAVQRALKHSVPDCGLFEIGQIVRDALSTHLGYTETGATDDAIFNPSLPSQLGAGDTPFEQSLVEKVARDFHLGHLQQNPGIANVRYVLTITDAYNIVAACRTFFANNPTMPRNLDMLNSLADQMTKSLSTRPVHHANNWFSTLGFSMDRTNLKSSDLTLYNSVIPTNAINTPASAMVPLATVTTLASAAVPLVTATVTETNLSQQLPRAVSVPTNAA